MRLRLHASGETWWMKVEHINPFIKAAYTVLEKMIRIQPEKGELAVRKDGSTSQQCTIVTGVTGALVGSVMYGMTLVTADKIASMMLGRPIRTFDQLAASAIAELANVISGNALADLADSGFVCQVAPPSIVRGTNVRITPLVDAAIVIPLHFEGGGIELCVSLSEPSAMATSGSGGRNVAA